MRIIFLSIIYVISLNNAYGSWANLLNIDPSNDRENGFKLELFSSCYNNLITVQFEINEITSKVAYFIVAKNRLDANEQNFRREIWQIPNARNENIRTDFINMLRPLNENKYKLYISEDIIERAFIYIDFPRAVSDGGYYYSIDLSKYPIHRNECEYFK